MFHAKISIPTTPPLNAKGGVWLPHLKIFFIFFIFSVFIKSFVSLCLEKRCKVMCQDSCHNCIWVTFNPTESDKIWYKQAGLGIKEVQIEEHSGCGVDLSFFKSYGALIDLSYDGKVTKIEILWVHTRLIRATWT